MPNIQLNDLSSNGSELFSDSETYLNDLTQEELSTQGGAFSTPICAVIVLSAYSVSIIASAAKSNPKSPHRP